MMFRDIQTKDIGGIIESMFKTAEYLSKIDDKQKGIEYFEILIRYIFSTKTNMTKDDVEKIFERIGNTYPEGSEIIMTIADIFREKGIEKGIEKGKYDERLNTTLKLLSKKFGPLSDQYRTGLSKLDAETLEAIMHS